MNSNISPHLQHSARNTDALIASIRQLANAQVQRAKWFAAQVVTEHDTFEEFISRWAILFDPNFQPHEPDDMITGSAEMDMAQRTDTMLVEYSTIVMESKTRANSVFLEWVRAEIAMAALIPDVWRREPGGQQEERGLRSDVRRS